VRGTPQFDALLGVLVEGNRVWVQHAGALVVVVAKTIDDNGSVDVLMTSTSCVTSTLFS
jgi:hypothetical protein